MLHRALPLALILATVGPSCRTTASPESEALRVLQVQREAWNRGDVEGFVAAGYWRSPELTFFSGGTVTKGYEATLERYRERYARSAEGMGELTFGELEPFALGEDAAMVRGRWKLERRDAPAIGGLFTVILRRIDGEWRIVHDHTSVDEPTP